MRADGGKVLNPGLLRHQITWRKYVVAGRDAFGETGSMQNVLTCRASVRSLFGRELEQAQQRWAEARYKIEQYYVPGLEREMQIDWYVDGGTRTLDVLDIADESGTGRYQTITAKDHAE